MIRLNSVQPSYFEILGMKFLLGTSFAPEKRQIVINATMARRYWGDRSPIGSMIRIGGRKGEDYEVTGVVMDGKYGSIHEAPQPYMFLPHDDVSVGESQLTIRFHGEVTQFRQQLRNLVSELSPDAALLSMLTLEEHYQRGLYMDRLIAGALIAFSATGIALAGIGLYGALAFTVQLQEKELAIRMAIGAHSRHVFQSVLKRGLGLTGVGIALGLPLSLIASSAVRGLLYGVRLDNPWTLVSVVSGVVAVMVPASLIPARRAARINPSEFLRL
jgi:hypothetical protein